MRIQYNVYFEVAAAFFTFFMAIYLRLQYSLKHKRNKLFFIDTVLVFLANVLDVASALGIMYHEYVPMPINILLSTVYFVINGCIGFYFVKYALSFENSVKQGRVMHIVEGAIFTIYQFIVIVGCFFGWVFYFDESGLYTHGPLYYIVFAVPYLFFTLSSIYLLVVAVKIGKKALFSVIIYMFVSFVGMTLQLLVFQDVLINVFAISVGITILMFSLETPEIEKLNDTMEQLEEATRTANAANDSKSRFLANMSHEIRTPINAILGMNELILRENKDEQIAEYAKDIAQASDSLLAVINDILDISKIESGKLELVEDEYLLSDMLDECMKLVKVRASAKNLEVKLEAEGSTPNQLIGDSGRIKEILVNLLTNAIKYTKEGAITIRVKSQPQETNICLILSVEDTGIGIKEENIDKLFDSYERFDSAQNKGIEGTGLGLSITKHLVEMMNGEIGVYSKYGEGSLFYVEIPQKLAGAQKLSDVMDRPEKKETPRDRNEAFLIAPRAKILVADDVNVNRKLIEKLLKRTQIQIDLAEGGRQAIDLAYENKYDAILLDHIMPEVDGVDALKEIKKSGCINCGTPIAVITANAISGMKEEYLEMGFDTYISKPVSGAALEMALIDLLPDDLIDKGE